MTAIVTDTHIGGTTALSLPEFVTDEGQTVCATVAQRWLFEMWSEYWGHVRLLCKKFKARLIVIHLGDVVDGDHHRSVQLLPNLIDQEGMACDLLAPLSDWSQRMFILRGTEDHAGEAASSEVRIAQRIGAEVMWEGLLQVDGVLLDVAHHGRASKRDWTSSAAGMAVQAQVAAMRMGHPVPRYVFRGHNHIVDDSGEKVEHTRAIACPSWQLRTAYGYKVASGTRSDIGGVIVLPDGSLDLSRLRYQAAPGQRVVTHV